MSTFLFVIFIAALVGNGYYAFTEKNKIRRSISIVVFMLMLAVLGRIIVIAIKSISWWGL